MCGRYNIITDPQAFLDAFRIINDIVRDDLLTNYNAAPSQTMPVVVHNEAGRREVENFSWGLIPAWNKKPRPDFRPINAKAETAHEKAFFRTPMRRQRCLVPASGYIEWDRSRDLKRPYNFTVGEGLFAMAGLWDAWQTKYDPEYTFTILTTDANNVVKPIHHRMPVILDPENYDTWLSPGTPPDAVRSLLKPYPSDRMHRHEISTRVNNTRNNGPECLEPA